jgi:DNA-binding MarR family transcriptional regulator
MKNKQNSPFAVENLEEDSGFLMLRVSRLWIDHLEKKLKDRFGLTGMQYAVLVSVYWLVWHNNRQVTQTVLAKHTKIDPMTISQMFKVLEKKGYILRKTHSADVRAKAVYLTQEGIDLMTEAIPLVNEADTKFFSTLGKDISYFNRYMGTLLKENS